MVEHEPVYTLGRHGRVENVLDPGGTPVVRTDRGGDVTWHGPGQLVGYPILSLRHHRLGVRAYVERLERVIIGVAAHFGVVASTRPGLVGVWCGERKLASIGVRVQSGVTRHGFALNVCNDLEPFHRINPCGMAGCAVTSLAHESGSEIDLSEAARVTLGEMAGAYGALLRA